MAFFINKEVWKENILKIWTNERNIVSLSANNSN